MLFEPFVESFATMIGSTNSVAGTLLGIVFTMLLSFIGLASTRGRSPIGGILIGIMALIVFTIVGWVNYWFLLIIILLIAGLYASSMRRWLTGGRT